MCLGRLESCSVRPVGRKNNQVIPILMTECAKTLTVLEIAKFFLIRYSGTIFVSYHVVKFHTCRSYNNQVIVVYITPIL